MKSSAGSPAEVTQFHRPFQFTAIRRPAHGRGYGVVAGTAKDIAGALPEDVWRRLSAGDGTKRARLHDRAYLELADLDAGDFDATFPGIWTRGLLFRRNIADGDPPIETLAHLLGSILRGDP